MQPLSRAAPTLQTSLHDVILSPPRTKDLRLPFARSITNLVTTGTMLLMWFGEQMTERGIGNGISMVITVSIVSRILPPSGRGNECFRKWKAISVHDISPGGLLLLLFAVTAGTVLLAQGQRKVPIHTTKRVIGRKVRRPGPYMPLRVNYWASCR